MIPLTLLKLKILLQKKMFLLCAILLTFSASFAIGLIAKVGNDKIDQSFNEKTLNNLYQKTNEGALATLKNVEKDNSETIKNIRRDLYHRIGSDRSLEEMVSLSANYFTEIVFPYVFQSTKTSCNASLDQVIIFLLVIVSPLFFLPTIGFYLAQVFKESGTNSLIACAGLSPVTRLLANMALMFLFSVFVTILSLAGFATSNGGLTLKTLSSEEFLLATILLITISTFTLGCISFTISLVLKDTVSSLYLGNVLLSFGAFVILLLAFGPFTFENSMSSLQGNFLSNKVKRLEISKEKVGNIAERSVFINVQTNALKIAELAIPDFVKSIGNYQKKSWKEVTSKYSLILLSVTALFSLVSLPYLNRP